MSVERMENKPVDPSCLLCEYGGWRGERRKSRVGRRVGGAAREEAERLKGEGAELYRRSDVYGDNHTPRNSQFIIVVSC